MSSPNDPLRVGIGGPVGAGKTTLTDALCKAMRDDFSVAAITNDIYTKEDAEALMRMQVASPVVFAAGVAVWAAVSDLTVAGALYLAVLGRVASIAIGPWRPILTSAPAGRSPWQTVLRTHVSSSVGVLVEFASYRVDVLFIAVFLTEPMGRGNSFGFYGEMVGTVSGSSSVSRDTVAMAR